MKGNTYEIDQATGCWLWQGRLNSVGYGLARQRIPGYLARDIYAHRWVYERDVGPIPDGLVLDHLCRTPRCVNPAHLEPVTHAENLRRGKGTKLTRAKVDEMRRRAADGESHKALAEHFGVDASYVSRVVRGLKWPKEAAPHGSVNTRALEPLKQERAA